MQKKELVFKSKKLNIKNFIMLEIKAFTLAEVLIALAIIGVVAALTIAPLLKNYNDKKYNTARLKALKTFGDAGRIASVNGDINGQSTAKNFVDKVLSKYLKIIKVCDTAEKCGFPEKIQPSDPDAEKLDSDNIIKWKDLNNSLTSTKRYFDANSTKLSIYLVSADGYSAKVFYNPNCPSNSREITWEKTCNDRECMSNAADQACMNVIYDMNGSKGPNRAGEDIGFVTTFWSGYNAISVAPGIIPYKEAKDISDKGSKKIGEAITLCKSKSTSKIQYSLPNILELQSLAINYNLTSIPTDNLWTGTSVAEQDGSNWYVFYTGVRYRSGVVSNSTAKAWCVRR